MFPAGKGRSCEKEMLQAKEGVRMWHATEQSVAGCDMSQVSFVFGRADRFKVQGSRLRKEKILDLPKKTSIRPV
jgi:hypothetical protein